MPKQQKLRDLSKYKLEGRQICYCQCTKHRLISNCSVCGKIVCEQEGEGPCLFCGAWVSADENEIFEEFEDEKEKAEYQKTLNHRDRLIDFDRNSA